MEGVLNGYSNSLSIFMQPFQVTFEDCFTEQQRSSASLSDLANRYNIKNNTLIYPLSFLDLVTAVQDHTPNNSYLGHDASVAGQVLKKTLAYDSFLSQYTKNDLILLNMFDITQAYHDYVLSFFPGIKEVLPIHLIVFNSIFIHKTLIPVCDSQEKVRFFFNPNQKPRSILSREVLKESNSFIHTNPFYKKFYFYYMNYLHEQSRKESGYIERDVTSRLETLRKITVAYREELESNFAKQEFKEFTNPYTWS
jgi:hypothetical protein